MNPACLIILNELTFNFLNNFATRGGLRTQVMHLVHDPEKTLKDIYVEADKLLQNEHGTNYNHFLQKTHTHTQIQRSVA